MRFQVIKEEKLYWFDSFFATLVKKWSSKKFDLLTSFKYVLPIFNLDLISSYWFLLKYQMYWVVISNICIWTVILTKAALTTDQSIRHREDRKMNSIIITRATVTTDQSIRHREDWKMNRVVLKRAIVTTDHSIRKTES